MTHWVTRDRLTFAIVFEFMLLYLDFRHPLVSGPGRGGGSAGSFPEQRLVIEPTLFTFVENKSSRKVYCFVVLKLREIVLNIW